MTWADRCCGGVAHETVLTMRRVDQLRIPCTPIGNSNAPTNPPFSSTTNAPHDPPRALLRAGGRPMLTWPGCGGIELPTRLSAVCTRLLQLPDTSGAFVWRLLLQALAIMPRELGPHLEAMSAAAAQQLQQGSPIMQQGLICFFAMLLTIDPEATLTLLQHRTLAGRFVWVMAVDSCVSVDAGHRKPSPTPMSNAFFAAYHAVQCVRRIMQSPIQPSIATRRRVTAVAP